MTMRIGMIGGGQMALALAAGVVRSGLVRGEQITVYDPSDAARERISAAVPGLRLAHTAEEAVRDAGLVFFCVKPQQAEAAAASIKGRIAPSTAIVSIVAGLPLSRLATSLGTARVIRVMPNTPCLAGKGVSVLCRGTAVADADAETVRRLLGAVGSVHEVEESLMNAVTGVSGSGPGFIARWIEALAEGGVAAGLPRALAETLARETFVGTATLLETTGESPAEIRRKVTSPGGTTLAGLKAMDGHRVPESIAAAVTAAAARAAELAQG
jgi:pyrroline-5-carboxylate reductase